MFFSLGEATSLGEENSEFKPVKLLLKIDLVSYPARVKGLVNMDIVLIVYIFYAKILYFFSKGFCEKIVKKKKEREMPYEA